MKIVQTVSEFWTPDELDRFSFRFGRRPAPIYGYGSRMTDSDRVDSRAAHLLPEEVAVDSDDPRAQAAAILDESDERTADPQAAPDSFVEHRTSQQAAT